MDIGEGPPIGEIHQDDFVNITSPTELSPQQNFFDLEPFSSTIEATAQSTGTNPIFIKKCLSYEARDIARSKEIRQRHGRYDPQTEQHVRFDPQVFDAEIQLPPHRVAIASLRTRLHAKATDDPEILSIVSTLRSSLADFPLWYDYVHTWRRRQSYNTDGSVIIPYYLQLSADGHDEEPNWHTPSYGRWVSNELGLKQSQATTPDEQINWQLPKASSLIGKSQDGIPDTYEVE